MTSILGKRKYQTDDDEVLSPDNLPNIPKFSKELFETADGLNKYYYGLKNIINVY